MPYWFDHHIHRSTYYVQTWPYNMYCLIHNCSFIFINILCYCFCYKFKLELLPRSLTTNVTTVHGSISNSFIYSLLLSFHSLCRFTILSIRLWLYNNVISVTQRACVYDCIIYFQTTCLYFFFKKVKPPRYLQRCTPIISSILSFFKK
jgi:hypothetical protein